METLTPTPPLHCGLVRYKLCHFSVCCHFLYTVHARDSCCRPAVSTAVRTKYMCMCTRVCVYVYMYIYIYTHTHTECLQMNGAVSKVNKKFISHLTRAQRTPLAAATAQVSDAPSAVSSLVLTAGPVYKMASQQEKAFCVLRFEVSRSVITVQREFRARFSTI